MRSLVILAGGKSSRMGRDKVLLKLNGMTFIERIFTNALICFDRIIISTDSDEHKDTIMKLAAFAPENIPAGKCVCFVTDSYDAVGPLGGILSVFEKSDVERFSIVSVDVPFASMEVLEALYDRCEKKAVFLKIGEKKPEPLIAAYDRSALPDIKRAVEKGLLKIRAALPKEDIDIISSEYIESLPETKGMDCAWSFRNFNTPEEFSEIESK